METYTVDLKNVKCCNRFECKIPCNPENCFNDKFKCIWFAIAIMVAEDKASDYCKCPETDYYHLVETICPHCGKEYAKKHKS